MNKKILVSLCVIGAVAAIAVGGTIAYYSDVEVSTGNTFTAGELDLKVDSTCHYDGMICQIVEDPTNDATSTKWVEESTGSSSYRELLGEDCSCSWASKDLTTDDIFFNFGDVKPGDNGENTISFNIIDNPSWACAKITVTADADVNCTEPEKIDDPNCADSLTSGGEMAKNLSLAWWADLDGNNILNDGEHAFFMNGAKLATLLNGGNVLNLTLADKNTNFFLGIDNSVNTTPLSGNTPYYIGMAWCFGDMSINGSTITCNGASVNNESQTDKLTADMAFYVEQSRNNTDFSCADSFRTVAP